MAVSKHNQGRENTNWVKQNQPKQLGYLLPPRGIQTLQHGNGGLAKMTTHPYAALYM